MKLDELRLLAEAAQIPFGQAMDGKRFTDAMVRVNRFQMEANPATILAMLDLIAQCKEALEWSASIYAEEPTATAGSSFDRGLDVPKATIRHMQKALAAIEQWEKK